MNLARLSIQASLPRRDCIDSTLRSLAESDVGLEPIVVGPAAYSLGHFLDSLSVLRSSKEDELAVRLEDDVIVNRHLRYNLESGTTSGSDGCFSLRLRS